MMFTLLGFGLILVQSFLSILQFFPLGMELLILCHGILEICNFHLILQRLVVNLLLRVFGVIFIYFVLFF